MEQLKQKCNGMDSKLADLLLDPNAVPAKVKAHVEACAGCREELAELAGTMALLDTWEAPEPSPYFLSRLDARMREERQAAVGPRGAGRSDQGRAGQSDRDDQAGDGDRGHAGQHRQQVGG